MAESIAIIFRNTNWPELEQSVGKIAEADSVDRHWKYPAIGTYSISLYEYDDWCNACEEDELSKIERLLEGKASATLCLEFRRSKQGQSQIDAKFICEQLLQNHPGIVDDAAENFWDLKGILGNKDFLSEYQ